MKKQKNKKRPDTNHPTGEEGLKTTARTNAPTAEDRIRQRAYEIHQARGGAPGQDLDDWLQAEREIKGKLDQASDAQAQALNHALGSSKENRAPVAGCSGARLRTARGFSG